MKQTTPKLICNITDKARATTKDYLADRLADLNIKQEDYLANYVCKGALKLLRQADLSTQASADKAITDIRKQLGSTATHPLKVDDLKLMLKYNGKQGGVAAGPMLSPRALAAQAEAAKNAPSKPEPAITVKPGAAPEATKPGTKAQPAAASKA